MASTPVSMVGFGTGANKGEWLPGSCGPSPSQGGSDALRLVTPILKDVEGTGRQRPIGPDNGRV